MAARGRATQQSQDKLSKATSSLFPINMIVKLDRTYSNTGQTLEQLKTPTMGVTINNKSATPETPH